MSRLSFENNSKDISIKNLLSDYDFKYLENYKMER